MAHGHSLCVYQGERRNNFLISGRTGMIAPIALTDGRFLDVRMGLAIHGTDQGPRLKVIHSVFQYQTDDAGNDWIFPYEYDRHPHRLHPPTHFHVRGELTENCLPIGETLEKIHFPASARVSLESVIRLLIDQFGVSANTPRSFWRVVLTESEKAFLDIAHRAVSGARR